MKNTSVSAARGRQGGFSLLEVLVVVAIIFVAAALTVPTLMTQVFALRIQYAARDLSVALQAARMEAVRKNSFYSINYVPGSPAQVQVVDKNQAVVTSISPAVFGNSVTGSYGLGGGAPAQIALMGTLNFAPAPPGANTFPSFNARGLPCVATAGAATCTRTLGQGFIFFLGGTSGSSGAAGWAAVAVTPSGRCEVFTWDGTNWIQQ